MRFFILIFFMSSFLFAEDSNSFDLVFDEHVKSLQYLEEIKPRLMITFSGVYGMGKTTLSKKLENQLHAIRISGDEIRPILERCGFKGCDLNKYTSYCIQRLLNEFNNELLIIDRNVNNNRPFYDSIARSIGAPIFSIRLTLSKESAKKRIISRGDQVSFLLENFDHAYSKYLKAGQERKFDYIFDNTEADLPNLSDLIATIENQFVKKKRLLLQMDMH